MYSLEFKERVIKDFNKIPQKDKIKIWDKLQKLKNEPWQKNTRKLAGRNDEYRIRYGNYRVIYQINDLSQKVLIIEVGHRKEIYK